MITKIRNYIFTGFFIMLPLIISVAVTVWLYRIITDGIINLLPVSVKANLVLQITIRLIIPFVFLFILAFVGIMIRSLVLRKTFSLGEKLLIKIPLFNKIYIALRQISRGILGKEKTLFSKVVLVEFPRKGLYVLGFITSKTNEIIQKSIRHESINVFIPTAPNPTGGILISVPKSEVAECDISVENGLKFVISVGAIKL